MSLTYLLLFFLCISLHACNARHLNTLDKKVEIKSHFSVKCSEKNGSDSFPKQLNDEDDNNKLENRLVADSEKPKHEGNNNNQKVFKSNKAIKASGDLKTESLVSVSWPVPYNEEPSDVFSSDYAPPKTHPPRHN
ncbi:hypothetical protein RIF29_25979 [Crotalaria pallida]|uniref:Uncharacterized protein n=1 Tax=Crotalaria pallida TaxID=3830 RepID=A0AAN9EUH3_CROPI